MTGRCFYCSRFIDPNGPWISVAGIMVCGRPHCVHACCHALKRRAENPPCLTALTAGAHPPDGDSGNDAPDAA
jgi:hypothetical protein